ncbi:hypothetical protein L1987_66123 [Smallanthus sonchifolius]|uniref:Uncharacterized protein n=1 Tax=Smallanthus sonchifolius TaxID=185202 RepID=A0ACB9BWE9_9ASTR|nr:hypothetical protein L1987_66123 [Smallanthus sonchifolius]
MESTLSFFLVILLPLVSSLSQYTLPDHNFINCGSNSDIVFTGKLFIGDDNRTTFSLSGDSTPANNNNPASNTQEIYRTARVFTQKSWYELEVDGNNTFVMVRLHFSPFFSNGFELSNSMFNVTVSGFSMLSNFNVRDSTVIKELIIPIQSERKFRIEFTPSNGSSRAFVNAIEAFTAPSELFRHGVSLPKISPAGKNGDMDNISSSYAFSPVYRVNVGGQSIDVDRDTLRRNWIPDDEFIFQSEPARNINVGGTFSYMEPYADSYDAPDDVYNTAKLLNDSSVNITWNFGVNKNARFLVRAHFCDIISHNFINPYDPFNFYIYSHYNKEINPVEMGQRPQIPFYYDFVVESDEKGFVNVSIGARPSTSGSQPVFLNGLEIMELLTSSGVVDFQNVRKSSKKVHIVVGCAVGGVVVVLIIGFFIGLKYRKWKLSLGKTTESNYGRSSYTNIGIDFTESNPTPIPNLNLNLRFQLADILKATNGFDESLLIGKGGFGKVYRGTFPDGMTVAVKRAEKGHGQGRPEFVTEIMVLSKIQHKHLVALIGYCDEKSEMILVYEFMEKGTLQDHLYDTVVLLEVLCARLPLDPTLPQNEVYLADWAINQMKDGMVESIIDPYLVGKINPNSLSKFLGTVERCLKNTGDERPTMNDVFWDLEYALKFQQMVVDKEAYEDSTINESMQLSMSMIDRMSAKFNDDESRVNDISVSSYPSESQVFSQLKIDEAR